MLAQVPVCMYLGVSNRICTYVPIDSDTLWYFFFDGRLPNSNRLDRVVPGGWGSPKDFGVFFATLSSRILVSVLRFYY